MKTLNCLNLSVARYLIETLLDFWKDYKSNMKQKKKKKNVPWKCHNHIRIEKHNKNGDKAEKAKELSSKANVVEDKPKPKNNRSRKQNWKTKPNSKNNVHNPTIKKKGKLLCLWQTWPSCSLMSP